MAVKLIIRRKGAAPDAPPLAERAFDDPIIAIGRDGASALFLDDPAVAPEQAIILNEDGQLLFINRADGTALNGEALTREARRPLAHGDTLAIGPYLISVAQRDDPRPTPAVAPRPVETRTPQEGARGDEAPDGGAGMGSFSAILDRLRTEEDRFYFEVVSAERGRQRVVIDSAEMLVGWDETGRQLSFVAAYIAAPRAHVRKDWSGVVIQPHGPGLVEVNGELVETVRRLRDGDRLTMLPTPQATGDDFLVFHEPASLVVLDSLLPQQLPPPVVAMREVAAVETEPWKDTAQSLEQATGQRGEALPTPRRYFGYFTAGEVLIMIVGTLLAAVIIFLVLEFL
ncbi:MAG TPA: FHA domain-containing protein [Pyrinomonadaceae bacterium]